MVDGARCECGSDATYGPNRCHASYCPLEISALFEATYWDCENLWDTLICMGLDDQIVEKCNVYGGRAINIAKLRSTVPKLNISDLAMAELDAGFLVSTWLGKTEFWIYGDG